MAILSRLCREHLRDQFQCEDQVIYVLLDKKNWWRPVANRGVRQKFALTAVHRVCIFLYPVFLSSFTIAFKLNYRADFVLFPSIGPAWASINRGVLICNDCCSVHRSLGRHISQVRHLKHGNWTPSLLEVNIYIFRFLSVLFL